MNADRIEVSLLVSHAFFFRYHIQNFRVVSLWLDLSGRRGCRGPACPGRGNREKTQEEDVSSRFYSRGRGVGRGRLRI